MNASYEEHTVQGMTIVAHRPPDKIVATELVLITRFPGGAVEMHLENAQTVDHLIGALQAVRDQVWPAGPRPTGGRNE
jgi:hypothetical protein